MARELRLWQAEAVQAVRAEWDAGVTRTAVVAATGLGKSSVVAKLATDEVAAGGRVLLLAHREELLDQLAETCRAFDPSIPVGKVQAATSQHRRPIVVASVATLRNPKRQARMLRPTMIVVDECHRAVSAGHLSVMTAAGAFEGVRTLGVTATMTRGDKKGLGDVWESVALVRDVAYGIEQGYLVQPRGRVVIGEHVELGQAKISRGDYQDAELGEMIAQDVGQVVKAWCEFASERVTVAFVPTVDSARLLCEEFLAHGVSAECVTGATPTADRKAMYARLAAGVTRVLVNVFVLVEGWDCPRVDCILWARPTKLRGVYIQGIGRGLRTAPGKTDCLVLDVVGASRTQRLVTLIDLHPTAQVNTDEIDALPCERCAGYVGITPAVVQAAALAGIPPCSCRCEDCTELRADCACSSTGPRDPDGGRRRLQGPAAYTDVDLLAPELAASELNWLRTPGGVSFVGAGMYLAAVTVDGGGFAAGWCEAWGSKPGTDLVRGASIEQARAAVESWAEETGAYPRSAPWRAARKRPSEASVRVAVRLGIASPTSFTAGGLSDAIDIARAVRRFDQ